MREHWYGSEGHVAKKSVWQQLLSFLLQVFGFLGCTPAQGAQWPAAPQYAPWGLQSWSRQTPAQLWFGALRQLASGQMHAGSFVEGSGTELLVQHEEFPVPHTPDAPALAHKP